MPGAVLDHEAAAAVVLLAARAALPRLRGHGGVDGLAHARLLHADLAEVGVLRGEELLARRADGQKRRRRRRRVREDVLACNLARPVVLAAGGVGDGVPRLVDDELAAGLEVAPVVPRVRVGAEHDAAAVVHRGQVGEASARGAGRGNALVRRVFGRRVRGRPRRPRRGRRRGRVGRRARRRGRFGRARRRARRLAVRAQLAALVVAVHHQPKRRQPRVGAADLVLGNLHPAQVERRSGGVVAGVVRVAREAELPADVLPQERAGSRWDPRVRTSKRCARVCKCIKV